VLAAAFPDAQLGAETSPNVRAARVDPIRADARDSVHNAVHVVTGFA